MESSDREFIQYLYDAYSKLMYFYARKYFQEQTAIEDAVQNAWIKLVKYLPKLKTLDRNVLPAYIVTIVKSVSIDLIRKLKSEKYVSFSEQSGEYVEPFIDAYSLEEEISKQISADELGKIILQLPERDQFVLNVKYLLGWKDREIAQMIGVKESTVRTLLSRARNRAIEIYLKDHNEKR